MCRYMHMGAGALEGQVRVLEHLEMELQVCVNYLFPTQGLETSARAVGTLNH